MRSHALHCPGCGWCVGNDEAAGFAARSRCAEFARLKAALARAPYLEVALAPTEEAGFAAAGVLLFRRTSAAGGVDVLLACEFRANGGDRLNFLGGKRRVKATTAAQVAVAKLRVEAGGQLQGATLRAMAAQDAGFPMVHWGARSKYALFLFELSSEMDKEVDVACAGVAGAKRLEWVPRTQLRRAAFVRAELHTFAAEMLRDVQDCRVLDQLEALFDCASRAAASAAAGSGGGDGGATDASDGDDAAAVAAKRGAAFDVLGALRASAAAARPDGAAPQLQPQQPQWRDLLRLAAALHKADMRKLCMRFHPDRLRSVLGGRAPTDEETLMSTKAMTVLNLLFSAPAEAAANSGAGMAALAELDRMRSPPAAAAARRSSGGGDDDDVDDLAAMLARVRMPSGAGRGFSSGRRHR
jgi:hypothetical protein